MASLEELYSSTVTPKESFPGVTKQGAPGGEYYVPTGASPGGAGEGTSKKPSLDQLYATSQEGAQTLQELQTAPGVDYTKGAPLSVRYNVSRAGNPEETELYLKGQYGDQGYRKDPGGNYLVKEDDQWVPVFPKGSVPEAIGSGMAHVAASAPSIAGGIAGGVAGTALGGPAGGVAGAGIGSGGGKLADEAAKAIQGFSDKTAGELAADVGGEAAMGALFQALPWMRQLMVNKGYSAISKGLQSVSGVTPEIRETVQGLQKQFPNVTPPIGSVAPSMKTFEYDRRLRNMLSKDPMAAPRLEAMDTRMSQVLQGFGLQGQELAVALHQIKNSNEALSGKFVGEEIGRRLGTRQNVLLQEETQAKDDAARHASEALGRLRALTNQDVGRLGEDVAGRYEEVRRDFTQDMSAAYNRVTRLTGDDPVVRTDDVAREAHQLLDTMDPQAVPPIIARLATGGVPMTFEEAHNLRTTLREMARIKDLSPIGQRRGNIRQMAGMVDDAMARAEGQVGQQAAAQLRDLDRTYREGIVRFTNADLNGLIREVRQGRMPNPDEVADLLVDKGSTDATRQMWGMLTPDIQARVRVADLRNMFDSASATSRDGRQMLDGDSLLKLLNDRRDVNAFLYPPGFLNNLRELARDFQAIDGTLDISGLQPGAVRMALERALGARRTLDAEAQANPRGALKSTNPEQADAGARFFMKPGNEAQTLAGAQLLAGPEWDAVQKYAILDLLKSAIMPKAGTLGSTVSGEAVQKYLSRYTAAQQAALFGPRLPDIMLLAKQAKLLFPELGDEFGGSLAAASIKGQLPKAGAMQRMGLRLVLGKIADSPTLTKLIVGQVRESPLKARGTLNYLMNVLADTGANQIATGMQRPREPEPQPPVGAAVPTFKQFMAAPKVTPERPKSYGGPL